jgi:hypothetical protein
MGEPAKKECATCGSHNLPNPCPGLMNKSLITIAEFCSDKCREEFLKNAQRSSKMDINDMCKGALGAAYRELEIAFNSAPLGSMVEADIRDLMRDLLRLKEKIK